MAELEIGPNMLAIVSLIANGLLAYWNVQLQKKCKHIKTDSS